MQRPALAGSLAVVLLANAAALGYRLPRRTRRYAAAAAPAARSARG